jgi:hypothetical protein
MAHQSMMRETSGIREALSDHLGLFMTLYATISRIPGRTKLNIPSDLGCLPRPAKKTRESRQRPGSLDKSSFLRAERQGLKPTHFLVGLRHE